MSLLNIRAALVTGWIAGNFGLTTYYENNNSEPTSEHANFIFMPVDTIGAALGRNGKDEHKGFVQIDLYYPIDTGTNSILTKVDAIKNYFYNGRGFTYSGASVVINRVDYASPTIDNGWYRQTLTIYWYSRQARS